MLAAIDLNSDLGEGAGTDALVMPHISSVNIACGAHAGNESTMRETLDLARRHNVIVGAHPGTPTVRTLVACGAARATKRRAKRSA